MLKKGEMKKKKRYDLVRYVKIYTRKLMCLRLYVFRSQKDLYHTVNRTLKKSHFLARIKL